MLEQIKRGFLFYALATLILAIQFGLYIAGNSIVSIMDFGGWMFFIASCISHASQLALVPFLLMVVLTLCRLPRVGWWTQVVLVALLCVLNYVNMQVYALYRFHINGFMLSMFFGPGAGEIFTFDWVLYLKVALMFILVVGVVVGASFGAKWLYARYRKAFAWPVALLIVAATLFAHVYHIYASFYQKPSVVKSAQLIPYYFPTTAYGLMVDRGFEPPVSNRGIDFGNVSGDINYPAAPLLREPVDSLPNIVFILIDSWNKRAADHVTMPNVNAFAQKAITFDNHFSSSNGTRSSIFGIFFGIPCYYWEAFEVSGVQPVLIEEMLRLGYDMRVYPSANIVNPPMGRVVFGAIPNLRMSTPGERVIDRDRQIAADFIADLDSLPSHQPFFSFLFFDLPHSYEIPKEDNHPFEPAWDYANYMALNNSLDPTPFFNLYRNCLYNDDILIGQVLDKMEQKGLMDNTIVIVMADHGQEFNENHKNYWGHSGNFTQHQIGTPLYVYIPGEEPRTLSHRTTHYDFVPTLMPLLGVTNPIDDYSTGRSLFDTTPRLWHFVGSYLNHAFLVEHDIILEKKADGALEVTDSALNLLPDYHINVREFREANERLNHFFK